MLRGDDPSFQIRGPVKDTMSDIRPDSHMLGRFPTTQWSRVVTAGSRDAPEAREALSGLCQAYWYPIYAYIRHRGYTPEQARDLTQDFFAYVLERDLFAKADPARGRFRAFLRTVCARQLAARRDQENAAKRGGGRTLVSIDPFDAERRYTREPAHELTPERIFDRTWALTLLDRVVERLRGEYDDAGRSARFEELIALLTRDPRREPTRRSPGGWGPPKGTFASPSIASGAATACCSARRSPRPSATRRRSRTKSGRSSPPWRAESRHGSVTFAAFLPTKNRALVESDRTGSMEPGMFSVEICPDCSARLPANSPAGLCPRCLLRLGAALAVDLEAGPGNPGATGVHEDSGRGSRPRLAADRCPESGRSDRGNPASSSPRDIRGRLA